MESINIKELNDRIQRESSFVDILTMEMNKVIVGQKHLVENLLIGLLAKRLRFNPALQKRSHNVRSFHFLFLSTQ